MQTFDRSWAVRPSRKRGPVAIYLALAALFSLSLAGFVASVWPEDSAPAAYPSAAARASPASGAFEGDFRPPPDAPPSARRSRWM